MKMEQENGKYEKVMEILRRAKPESGPTHEIEEKILARISGRHESDKDLSNLVDFLFGWTYIKWVRRSLVTASICLVLMFVLQQSIMMKQIYHLTRQIESYEIDASGFPGDYHDRRMMLLRFSERRFPFFKKSASDKQVQELFRTIDELKKEYKELDKMIEENPELKKLIEKKLSEIDGSKIKI
jgi:hypothetical protein